MLEYIVAYHLLRNFLNFFQAKADAEKYVESLKKATTENVELRSKLETGEKSLKSVNDELLMARAETEKVIILSKYCIYQFCDIW